MVDNDAHVVVVDPSDVVRASSPDSGATIGKPLPPLDAESLIIDVSELERLQHRAMEERQRLFREAPSGWYRADADGRLLECNAALLRMLGLDARDQTDTLSIFDFYVDADSRAAVLEALQSGRAVRNHDVELRQPNGRRVSAVQTALPTLAAGGGLEGFRGFVVDRTVERQLEEQLTRSQKIEAIGRLAGGVAHDFNNLLTVILSYAASLEQRLEDEDARRMVTEVRNAGERAADLTRRLLAFGRRQAIRTATLDVNGMVRALAPLLSAAMGERVRLECTLAEALPPIRGDRGQLEQVLMNLVVNARDALPDGGSVRLETGVVHLDASQRKARPWSNLGPHVRIAVIDEGVGMSRDVMEHVFEPFFTTKDPARGTGLGLASAYGIVRQHHGVITAHSEPGHGTTMEVLLPVSRPRDLNTVPQGGMLLVADDDELVRRKLSDAFTTSGYSVIAEPTGERAFRQLEADPTAISLIVLDVIMPGIGGIATYERMRLVAPSTPVLFTSGFGSEAARLAELDDPRVYFIAKPFDVEEVAELVQRILDECDAATDLVAG